MKKLLLLVLLTLLSSNAAYAYSCFSMGVNDTIWINPYMSPQGKVFHVHAQADYCFNIWSLDFSYPTGLSAITMSESSSMLLPYVNSERDTTAVWVSLYPNSSYTTVSASCMVPGYWTNENGVFETYGAVKWMPGYYENMFTVRLQCGTSFSGGSITIGGDMEGTSDARFTPLGHVSFTETVTVMPGNMLGDVNGDDVIDINDVSTLLNFLLDPNAVWDVYRMAAADVNGDGSVTISDVSALINMMLAGGNSVEGIDLPEFLNNTDI